MASVLVVARKFDSVAKRARRRGSGGVGVVLADFAKFVTASLLDDDTEGLLTRVQDRVG